jgi:PAS domain S-box-containing protein
MKNLRQQDMESRPLGMVLERWAAHSDLSIVIANAGGFIVWVNPAFTRMCGYNSDELLGRQPGHILCGELSEKKPRKLLNHAIRHRVPVRTRLINYKKSGEPYWVEIHLEPIHELDGRLSGFVSIELDVTKDELHQHEIGELSAVMYDSLIQKVTRKREVKFRSKSSRNKHQPNLNNAMAKRNRTTKSCDIRIL